MKPNPIIYEGSSRRGCLDLITRFIVVEICALKFGLDKNTPFNFVTKSIPVNDISLGIAM